MTITRFAPSPTGDLHIGGLRTALYAYALAKKNQGRFLLRIEDTDRKRLVPGSEQQIIDLLKYFDLEPDQIFRQSDRLPLYQKYALQLIDQGDAYYCFAAKEEIESARKLAEANGEIFKFRSPYRDLPLAEARARVARGEKYVIRQKLPDNQEVDFSDELQGKMKFNTNDIDETVLLKSDGFPTYHLAVVVDDHLMEITDVFRGVEWIPSVPKHVLLFKALGFAMPRFYHLTVILDPEGGKLSKRKGAVATKEFIKLGYLKEALLNFLMLLGWSAPIKREHGTREQEIFSREEFIEMFAAKDLNKSSPVFNREKLLWFNQKYLQELPLSYVEKAFTTWLREYGANTKLEAAIAAKGPDFLQQVLALERSRAKLLSDLPQAIKFFYFAREKQDIAGFKKTKNLKPQQIKDILAAVVKEAGLKKADFSDWQHEQWESSLRKLAEVLKLKPVEVFMTLRIALTYSEFSPPLYEVMQILGKTEVLQRIKIYL